VLRLFTADAPPDVTFARMGLGIMYQCLERGMRAIAAPFAAATA
jgi:hypothetical protein